eukprot:CAMPEP_0197073298 /NCGR_PEP_ID=MMETSP1384-20130603/210534_1 /TAXON_ID=29189 /ORGANISM="Ammonia sp." /LENGTH=353 /DNA_ID=CAMNT_0042512131 /DNA_START=51 /DNA_END=1112 /DNA_ORIENTATION=-
MGACCVSDPSEDERARRAINTEQREGVAQAEANDTSSPKQAGRHEVPDESMTKSTLNVPYGQETEESLLVPSTLSAVDDIHDPPPPSDYEDNADSYAIAPDEDAHKNDSNDHDPPPPSDYEDNADSYAIAPDEDAHKNDSNENNNNNDNSQQTESPNDDGAQPAAVNEKVDEQPAATMESGGQQADKAQEADKADKNAAVGKAKLTQKEILENEELKQRSIRLVNGDNQEFIKFLKKILKSKLKEKIWAKCDQNNTGEINTEKFMYFWTLPVTLFKVAVHQRVNGKDAGKPKVDQKELKLEFQHLATWIVRRYGEKESDDTSSFVLKKEHFDTDIVEYVQAYAAVSGELYEEY